MNAAQQMTTETYSETHSAKAVMTWISRELARIAVQIEQFPIVDGHAYSIEDITALQAIDASRQTLMDLHQVVLVLKTLLEDKRIDERELCSCIVLENTLHHIEELG